MDELQADLPPPRRPGEEDPLAGYSILTSLFTAGFTGGLFAAYRHRDGFDQRTSPWDLVLVGTATHKLTRLISKARVTSFLRAPFVRPAGRQGHGEVNEVPQGTGLRKAASELLTCPYCLGQWVAAAFGIGLLAAPRFTRLIAFIYSAETASDFLQLAYRSAEDAAS